MRLLFFLVVEKLFIYIEKIAIICYNKSKKGGVVMKENLLIEKSIAFASRIIKLHQYLIKTKKETIISKQIVRSGTSIGANINEANYGQSKADFVSKMHIALKETAETEYWLKLLTMSEYITEDIMEIKISTAAAAVYLIAFVFSITTDSYGGEPFGSVVCKNLYMILTPALAYSGVMSAKRFIKKKRIRVGFLLILSLGLLAMTGYLFNILSLLGIICIFASNAKEWAEKND